jgi:putative salt-induced outer membrane protein
MLLRFLLLMLCAQSYGLSAQEKSISPNRFAHESEASIVAATGNSPFETYNLKSTNNYEMKRQEIVFGGHYQLGTIGDDKIEIARNWDVNAKYARTIDKVLEGFLGGQVEGDEFAGYSERNNIDLGFVWKHVNTDDRKFRSELSYRHTVEVVIDGQGINEDNKLRLYSLFEDKVNANVRFKFWLEYIPNLTTPEDYMVNFEPSMQVTLSKILSLKLSYKGMYDNLPAIAERRYFDAFYSTSLIAKF